MAIYFIASCYLIDMSHWFREEIFGEIYNEIAWCSVLLIAGDLQFDSRECGPGFSRKVNYVHKIPTTATLVVSRDFGVAK